MSYNFDATQATQAIPDLADIVNEITTTNEQVWAILISLNPTFPNIELSNNEYIFGRQSQCDVQYNDLNISGKHCRIFLEGGPNNDGGNSHIAFIQDLSTNGTFVNGIKLGKNNRMLLTNRTEITLFSAKKPGQTKIAYLYQDINEDKDAEVGGPHKKYDLRETLGTGAFALVKLAINRASGERFAIKIIDKKKHLAQAGPRKDQLLEEVRILQGLDHKNIIHVIEVFETEKTLYIVLELVEGGELFEDIVKCGHYNEAKTKHVVRQLLDAVYYLHEKGIVHRDLKPENILIKRLKNVPSEADLEIKLTDFGLSRALNEGSFMKTMCGTPQFLAPEILQTGGGLSLSGYGKEVDMWSLGGIIYTMLCGSPPFDDTNERSIFEQIKSAYYQFSAPVWSGVSKEAKDLIQKLLCLDPKKRFCAKQTKAHPWFTGEPLIEIEEGESADHGVNKSFDSDMTEDLTEEEKTEGEKTEDDVTDKEDEPTLPRTKTLEITLDKNTNNNNNNNNNNINNNNNNNINNEGNNNNITKSLSKSLSSASTVPSTPQSTPSTPITPHLSPSPLLDSPLDIKINNQENSNNNNNNNNFKRRLEDEEENENSGLSQPLKKVSIEKTFIEPPSFIKQKTPPILLPPTKQIDSDTEEKPAPKPKKNPEKEKEKEEVKKDETKKPLTKAPSKAKPPCKYGAKCYRKNVVHFQEFSHPGRDDDD